MELTHDDREFVEAYRKAKRNNDTDFLIAVYAIMNMLLERQGSEPTDLLIGFTRGQYKRAIKCMRLTQAYVMREGRVDAAAEYDRTVRYIREHCLNRTAVAA